MSHKETTTAEVKSLASAETQTSTVSVECGNPKISIGLMSSDVDCQHTKLTASAGAARHSVQATIQSVCASATWLVISSLILKPFLASETIRKRELESEHDSTKAQVSCTKNSVSTQVGNEEKHGKSMNMLIFWLRRNIL